QTSFPEPLERIREVLTRENTWQGELIHRTKDSRAIVVMSHWILHRDERDQPMAILEVNNDITESKQAEERLRSFTKELEAQVEDRTRDLLQSQQRLRALATELNLAEQRERKRLAMELHDHLQQTLVLGRLTVGQGKRAASAGPAYL